MSDQRLGMAPIPLLEVMAQVISIFRYNYVVRAFHPLHGFQETPTSLISSLPYGATSASRAHLHATTTVEESCVLLANLTGSSLTVRGWRRAGGGLEEGWRELTVAGDSRS